MKKENNHGEGNRQADREYREGIKRQMDRDDMESLAREAKDAVKDPKEGAELERARRGTKRGAPSKGTS